MNININKYSWDEIKYQTDGWKTCEKNNLTRGRYTRDIQSAILGQFYADKNHTKIMCEYSAIKRWLRCRDIPRIEKISDARTIKNRWLRTKISAICADKDKR